MTALFLGEEEGGSSEDGIAVQYLAGRLGVDGLAEGAPAFSNANKITTDPSTSQSNWVFFALTYQSNGQTQFYFGNNTTDASLDATVNYTTPGVTGSNISNFYMRAPSGGFLDEIRVYGSVLTLEEIIGLQQGLIDNIPPTSPGSLSVSNITTTSVRSEISMMQRVTVQRLTVFSGD